MGRPFNQLKNYVPALSQGEAAVTLQGDMQAQLISQTFVGGSVASLNIVLNSLKTSNVALWLYADKGFSFNYSVFQVTDANASAVFVGVNVYGVGGSVGASANQNVPMRGWLVPSA